MRGKGSRPLHGEQIRLFPAGLRSEHWVANGCQVVKEEKAKVDNDQLSGVPGAVRDGPPDPNVPVGIENLRA